MSRPREQPRRPDDLEEPPERFRYSDWADPADRSLTFMDGPFVQAVRRWSEAKRVYGEATR